MRRFKCTHCQALITVSETRGQDTTCPQCNTRQAVPENAVLIDYAADVEPPRSLPLHRAAPLPPVSPFPPYVLMVRAGYLTIVLGAVIIAVGIFILLGAIIKSNADLLFLGAQLIVGGIITMGLGQLFHAIRDIAQNSFPSRPPQ